MKALTIAIGDEILIGQIVDSNSSFIAKSLNSIGIEVKESLVISDEGSHLIDTLTNYCQKVDLIIITGGLGPTSDDGTKEALAQFYNSELVYNEVAGKFLKQFLGAKNIPMNDNNKGQAYLPSNCIAIENKMGTAPGMLFTENDCLIFSLPGVPFEMKNLMETEVLPYLKAKYTLPDIVHKTIHTIGLQESVLAEKLFDFEKELPKEIKLAYLPNPKQIRMRFSAIGIKKDLDKLIDQQIKKLIQIIPDNIISQNEEQLEEVVGNLLKERKLTVVTAESCTGGYIAHRFTIVPGSSDYFLGSFVVYNNKLKENVLNVSPQDIIEYGAVSEQVVSQMAKNALLLSGADYAVATSGIAGPTGGTEEKPVGTVWISVANKHNIVAKRYQFGNHRERNIIRSSYTALNMLRKSILDEE